MGKNVEKKQPCDVPGCGSSDASYTYEDEGTYKRYKICFSANCPKKGKAIYLDEGNEPKSVQSADYDPFPDMQESPIAEDIKKYLLGEFQAQRGLTEASLEHYGVKTFSLWTWFPYFNPQLELIGFKVRDHKKSFMAKGQVSTKGQLFGQQAFKPGGRYITVHEGEFDAIAGFQMTGSKWAHVSLPTGAGSALEACKANYDYLNTFDNIILSFDADEAGQKNIKDVAALFGGKSKILRMKPDLKDANGYLMANQGQDWVDSWWKAEIYVPDGIVRIADLKDRMQIPLAPPIVPWPYPGLNEKIHGIYARRIYTLCAGSGVGKSQFVKEIIFWLLTQTKDNIGLLMLEEASEETALDLMSLYLNKPLHVPRTERTEEEYNEAFQAVAEGGRIVCHDHFGSTSTTNILDRIRYMAVVMGCKFIVLDHLSIVVSAQLEADERKTIDRLVTQLRMLVQETGITLFMISHLNRVGGKVFTEGAAVSTMDLRGSAGIEQISDYILALERNGQSEDEVIANLTKIRILKSRRFGRLGLADSLKYDIITGRMTLFDNSEIL